MDIRVFEDRDALGRAAAAQAAASIRQAIVDRGQARIVAATAASQKEFLEALTSAPGIDWTKVEAFHLDEYIGLPISHPGSFRKMLLEQLIQKTGIVQYHLLDGDGDAEAVVARASAALTSAPIDLAFLGIGENGHLAFNDPPADFETDEPYIVVNLDQNCRQQQVGEGWFKSLDEVPTQAISMSIKQILRSRYILCIVPDQRKAIAVKNCVELEVNPMHPASILQKHESVTLYLDRASASLLLTRVSFDRPLILHER